MPKFFPKGPVKGGLVLWLPMQEIVGGEVKDISGNANHGTVNGAVIAAGKIGNGLDFDGVDDYVEAPNDASLDITPAITLEGYFYFSDISSNRLLIEYGQTGGNAQYFLHFDSTGILQIGYWDGSNHQIYNYTWTPTLDTWYHIVGVINGSNAYHYIDNVLKKTTAQINNITSVASSVLRIGTTRNGISDFNGKIDEVRIYNRALSVGEINHNFYLKKHYNKPKWLD